MKPTRTIQILAGAIIAIALSAFTTTATPARISPTDSLNTPSHHTNVNHAAPNSSLNPISHFTPSQQDRNALRSNYFVMRDPMLYTITTSSSYGPAIRRARIRRKGNLHR